MTHPATAEGIYQGMRSGMIAAEALRDVMSRSKNEQQAWTGYQSRCRRVFVASFWSAGLWHRAVASPLLDVVVRFGQTPMAKTALAKLMARM